LAILIYNDIPTCLPNNPPTVLLSIMVINISSLLNLDLAFTSEYDSIP